MATSDGYQSSELPSCAPAWCGVNCSWDLRGCLPSNWQDGPGHRSHGPASGSGLGWHPWMPQHLRKKASDFHTPRSQRSRWWSDVIRLPFVLLARVHGLVLGILKMNFVIGPYADFARRFTFFALNFLLRANGCSISTLTSEALVHFDSLPLCSLGVR